MIFRNSIRNGKGILFSMMKIPPDDILEGLYKRRTRESEKLRTILGLYNMEIHQKETMVKRSIEQNLRLKNFEARNGSYGRNAVVKSQGTVQREQSGSSHFCSNLSLLVQRRQLVFRCVSFASSVSRGIFMPRKGWTALETPNGWFQKIRGPRPPPVRLGESRPAREPWIWQRRSVETAERPFEVNGGPHQAHPTPQSCRSGSGDGERSPKWPSCRRLSRPWETWEGLSSNLCRQSWRRPKQQQCCLQSTSRSRSARISSRGQSGVWSGWRPRP